MIDKIKVSLRIKHAQADEDLQDIISACKMDLQRVGVTKTTDDDFLIIQAVKLYVKWHWDFEGQADRYRKAYEALRDSLSLCGDYNV